MPRKRVDKQRGNTLLPTKQGSAAEESAGREGSDEEKEVQLIYIARPTKF